MRIKNKKPKKKKLIDSSSYLVSMCGSVWERERELQIDFLGVGLGGWYCRFGLLLEGELVVIGCR